MRSQGHVFRICKNPMTQKFFIHLLFILSKSLLVFNQPNPLKILIMSLKAANSLALRGSHTRVMEGFVCKFALLLPFTFRSCS